VSATRFQTHASRFESLVRCSAIASSCIWVAHVVVALANAFRSAELEVCWQALRLFCIGVARVRLALLCSRPLCPWSRTRWL